VDLGPITTATLVVVALGAAVLAIVIPVGAHPRRSGVQARHRILWTGCDEDVIEVLADQSGEIAHLHGDVEGLRTQLSRTPAMSSRACVTLQWSAMTRAATWAAGSLCRRRSSPIAETGW
jgi:hypothetical protein